MRVSKQKGIPKELLHRRKSGLKYEEKIQMKNQKS